MSARYAAGARALLLRPEPELLLCVEVFRLYDVLVTCGCSVQAHMRDTAKRFARDVDPAVFSEIAALVRFRPLL